MTSRAAAVVLNYRTPADTILAVRTLQAADADVAPIVLVDNGSGDESVDLFRRHLAGVDLLILERNHGFSDGCNAGIRRALDAGADSILLVNSDVILPPGTMTALQRILDGDARVGIVSPIVRSRRDPDVVESVGLSYQPTTGRMRLVEHGSRIEDVTPFDSRIVDAVSGCVMLIRRDVFDAIGLLRGEYFFTFEDLDFCCRARAAGWLSVCAGSAFVLHAGHHSITRSSPRRAYFATRNHLLLASRFPADRSRVRKGLRLASVLALNVAHVVAARDIPTARGLIATLSGARDFFRGRLGDGSAGGY